MNTSPKPLAIALYQPDIPQNTGAIMRLCACFGLDLHIIEPCGFLLDDRRIRKAGLDYSQGLDYQRHASWQAFMEVKPGRLVLATTKASQPLSLARFLPGDVILMGRESAGVPDEVAEAADQRLRIPMRADQRSLNVAMSAGILAAEAMRQIGWPGLA
jgi:tRNA (cytidine/uridine-2'-O-)-methyltransferase